MSKRKKRNYVCGNLVVLVFDQTEMNETRFEIPFELEITSELKMTVDNYTIDQSIFYVKNLKILKK